jgi:hypothetical protein
MKTYYVRLEYSYEEVEVEAENEKEAEKEAKDVVKRGWVTPTFVDVSVMEGE